MLFFVPFRVQRNNARVFVSVFDQCDCTSHVVLRAALCTFQVLQVLKVPNVQMAFFNRYGAIYAGWDTGMRMWICVPTNHAYRAYRCVHAIRSAVMRMSSIRDTFPNSCCPLPGCGLQALARTTPLPFTVLSLSLPPVIAAGLHAVRLFLFLLLPLAMTMSLPLCCRVPWPCLCPAHAPVSPPRSQLVGPTLSSVFVFDSARIGMQIA